MSLSDTKPTNSDKKRSKIYLLLIIFIALGIGFGVSYALSQKAAVPSKQPAADDSGTSSKLPAGRLEDINGKAVYEVPLKKGNKEPIDIVIKKGEYVQFNSKDGNDHQIIQGRATDTEHGDTSPAGDDHHEESATRPEKSKALDSGVFKGTEGYLLQFNTPGKFEFHDNYDHAYTMNILVYDPAGPTKIQ